MNITFVILLCLLSNFIKIDSTQLYQTISGDLALLSISLERLASSLPPEIVSKAKEDAERKAQEEAEKKRLEEEHKRKEADDRRKAEEQERLEADRKAAAEEKNRIEREEQKKKEDAELKLRKEALISGASIDAMAALYTDLLLDSASGTGYKIFSSKSHKWGLGLNTQTIKKYLDDINEIYCRRNPAKCGNAFLKPRLFNDDIGELKRLMTPLAGAYKIHLMPTKENIFLVFAKLLEEINSNTELQENIYKFKIVADIKQYFEELPIRQQEIRPNIPPLIVIYAANGKEKAQKSLNIIKSLFKDTEGLNITPRYNQKVTDLIYYAQGDSDMKDKYPNLFEKDKIFYKNDLTEEVQVYKLDI